jgi:hypothetical protein
MRFVVVVLLALFLVAPAAAQSSARTAPASPVGPLPAEPNQPLARALILFAPKARHIDLAFALRTAIEQTGGRMRIGLGITGIVADVEKDSVGRLKKMSGVQAVVTSAADVPTGVDRHAQAAIAAWQRMAEATSTPARPPTIGPPLGAPSTDALEPPDLPRDAEHKREIESEYRRQWEERRRSLPPELRRSRPSPSQRSGPGQVLQSGCGTNGGGFFDTSLYLAGDIVVGVFYVNGTIGGWNASGGGSTGSTTQTFADVVSALNQLIDAQPNARIVFTVVNEVDNSGNPLAPPAASAERQYVNNNRNIYCTDWASMITISNGGVWPNAYIQGPSQRNDIGWAQPWLFSYQVLHENGHVFGAGDQYAPHDPGPRYGYMQVTNGNACGSGGGNFSGAGDCLDDLMNGWQNGGYSWTIGHFSAGQFGWYSSDGDGVPDLLKTTPVIDATTVTRTITSTKAITYGGTAIDRPVLSQLSSAYSSVSINRVVGVEYRINGAAWQQAVPSDGVWDSNAETFTFLTPNLPNGTYTIEIRAVNTIGTVTPNPYVDQVTITGSSVTAVRPFGALTVSPGRAKFGTPVVASASASRDLQSSPLQYSWNWGSGWSGWSSGSSSSHIFTTPGTYTVQMRVRNTAGLVHQLSRTVQIESYDTSPTVVLNAWQENQHSPSNGPYYSVHLSVAGTTDSETPYANLTVAWDIGCTGSWQNGPKSRVVTLLNPHHPRSDRRCIRAKVTDGANNSVQATRYVWLVPYNHQPTFAAIPLTSTPSGPNYVVTVHATDPDPTWDGILEYRFDYEGDGIWDTTFSSTPSVTVTPAQLNTLVVEVKDRFYGRIRTSAQCGFVPAGAC